MYPLFIFIQITVGNLIQGLLSAFLWDILLHKKGISVIIVQQNGYLSL